MKPTLKSITYLLLFTIFSTLAFGQTQKIDSLKSEVIKYSHSKMNSFSCDTNLVNTYNAISKSFFRISNDSSLLYGNKALELSKKIKWKLGESMALFHLGYHSHLIYEFNTAIEFYQKSIDILIKLYPELKGGALALKYYDFLVISNNNIGKYSTSVEIGHLMLETAIKTKNLEMQISSYNVLGSGCRNQNKNLEAITYYSKGIEIAKERRVKRMDWQVPDKETAEFMELFYKNLTKMKDISIAFNTTQKAMRKKYDPFYWAAFTLIK